MDQKKHIRYLKQEEKLMELEEKNGLIIPDRDFMEKTIETIGYDALIGIYKPYFVNPLDQKYALPTTFGDILALYSLNESMGEATYHHLSRFEPKFRGIASACFVEAYGNNQKAYLEPNNYNAVSNNEKKELARLLDALDSAASKNTSHDYLVVQRAVHKNVPLGMAMKTFMFSQTGIFYNLLHPFLQSKIAKFYLGVSRENLGQYLKCLTIFRNICVHRGEDLLSFRLSLDFPDAPVHQRMGISKVGRNYVQGKKDYFGVMIAFKYLLAEEEFAEYVKEVKFLIDEYLSASQRLKGELFDYLGFPSNWLDVVKIPS